MTTSLQRKLRDRIRFLLAEDNASNGGCLTPAELDTLARVAGDQTEKAYDEAYDYAQSEAAAAQAEEEARQLTLAHSFVGGLAEGAD